MTGSELVAFGRVAAELEPALANLAQVTGADLPAKEISQSITQRLYYRRQVKAAELIMATVEKIRATGIPPHAVADRTLRAVLEDGGIEDDPDLQARWTNLLANEATGGRTPPAYLRILSELEPAEARAIDQLVAAEVDHAQGLTPDDLGVTPEQLENLLRLGLLRLRSTLGNEGVTVGDLERGLTDTMVITPLASAFVKACRLPTAQ